MTEKRKSCCQFTQSAASLPKAPRDHARNAVNLEHFLLDE
jgi:hypothetical protein